MEYISFRRPLVCSMKTDSKFLLFDSRNTTNHFCKIRRNLFFQTSHIGVHGAFKMVITIVQKRCKRTGQNGQNIR